MNASSIWKCGALKVANFQERRVWGGGILGGTGYQTIIKFTSLVFCIFFAINLIAQYKYDYTWLVGDPITQPSDYNGVSVFNFNGDSLHITKQWDGLAFYLSNVSMSNDSGELQFYSNGCKVFTKDNQLMENGSGLNPGDIYLSGNCPDYGAPIAKGMIGLPMPGSSSKYYLFHQTTEAGMPGIFSLFVAKFYYTVVDMSQNDGMGKVIEKNHLVINDTLFADLHAVKHANGQDWWIVFSKEHRNTFYKVLFMTNGVDTVLTQEVGIDPDRASSGGGQSCFSPDGTKYARMNKKDQVTLFDFDRATGELSNFQQIIADTQAFWTSLSFSSNSRFLYVSTTWKLWQFDMLAPDIQASKMLIDTYDGFTYLGQPMIFYLMQLAPDCKIYMIGSNGTKFLHVIEHPDQPGLACDFRQHGLELPAINNTSIPNFPNYRLGTGYPVCDSNIVYVSGSGFLQKPLGEVKVYPNPASGQVTVSLPAPLPVAAMWSLHDALGRELSHAVLSAGQQEVTVGLAGVVPGLYFWQLQSEGKLAGSGKLVVLR